MLHGEAAPDRERDRNIGLPQPVVRRIVNREVMVVNQRRIVGHREVEKDAPGSPGRKIDAGCDGSHAGGKTAVAEIDRGGAAEQIEVHRHREVLLLRRFERGSERQGVDDKRKELKDILNLNRGESGFRDLRRLISSVTSSSRSSI